MGGRFLGVSPDNSGETGGREDSARVERRVPEHLGWDLLQLPLRRAPQGVLAGATWHQGPSKDGDGRGCGG